MKVTDLYSDMPATRENFIKDVWEAGNVGLVVPPSETWIVDRNAGTVHPGSGNFKLEFRIQEATSSAITARVVTGGNYVITVLIDRISGQLELTTIMPQADIESWRAKHGKPHPGVWTWTQNCSASARPIF